MSQKIATARVLMLSQAIFLTIVPSNIDTQQRIAVCEEEEELYCTLNNRIAASLLKYKVYQLWKKIIATVLWDA